MDNREFEQKIPDAGIREFIVETIFGDNKFGSSLNYYEAMDNIVTLAFLYSFCCYLELRNSTVNREGNIRKIEALRTSGNANSKRVASIFDKIYTDHPITDELMQFVLLDIQFDAFLGFDSKLRTYFPLCINSFSDDFNLTEIFSMINKYHISSRDQDITIDALAKKFSDLIDFFPFLSKTQLVYDKESGWYAFKIKPGTNFENGIIHTYGVIQRFKCGKTKNRYFYLSSIKKEMLRYDNAKGCIKCILNGDASSPYPEIIEKPYEINADLESIATYLNPNIQNYDVAGRGYATQIYSINYKYIKHLALAISDALGRPVYKEVVEHLKTIFKSTSEKNDSHDLDTFVLMLLIENSPIRVLNVLIAKNQQIAFEIIKNLKSRLGRSDDGINIPLNDAEAFENIFDNSIKEHLGDCSEMSKELLNECKAELKTDLILRFVSAVNNSTSFHFSTRLKQGIESLDSISKNFNSSSNEILYRTIANNLCSIIKRITCFYAGVIGYGKYKIEYDSISEFRLPSQEEIAQYQKNCLAEFVKEAKNKWLEIKEEKNVKKVIELFVELCAKCSDSASNNRQGRSDESFRLHSVVGKYGIINIEKFKEEIDFDNVSELTTDLSKESLRWWLEKAIRIVRFLATGSFENTAADNLSRAFIRTINPILASFYRINNSRDGHNSAVFFLTMDANYDHNIDFQKEINVLSEFNYNMNKKYYCLPNVSRADDSWWIDPLLVDCDSFDKIFEEKE